MEVSAKYMPFYVNISFILIQFTHLNTRYGRPVRWAYSISATSSAPLNAMPMSVPKVFKACGQRQGNA
jgi:hypothetical protein